MTPALNRRPRTPADLVAAQLLGLDAWHRRAAEGVGLTSPPSREATLLQRRRTAVLAREHAALVARTAWDLERSGTEPMHELLPVRVVVGHRHAWFRDGLGAALRTAGAEVVCASDNGAEVIGMVTAEQPDLVVLDSNLAMVPSAEVVSALRGLSAHTLVTLQADGPSRAAGAHAAFGRGDSPCVVARTALALLGGDPVPEYAVAT